LAKNKVHIAFTFAVTRSEAEAILKEAGLQMDSFYRQDYVTITVPIGQERYYIDRLKQLPSVESANLIHFTHI
jgi:hypothetical protein